MGFFLLGVTAPQSARVQHLIAQDFPKSEAERLLAKDAAEDDRLGQQTRRTFELADAYLRVEGGGERAGLLVRQKVNRIVDLLMSCPFQLPTREEYAMFLAYAAALRSGDLSRQVGAVVMNAAGDLVASGSNDAPAPGAGRIGRQLRITRSNPIRAPAPITCGVSIRMSASATRSSLA